MRAPLTVCLFLKPEALTQSVTEKLKGDHFSLCTLNSFEAFCSYVKQEKQQIDCLILQNDPGFAAIAEWLKAHATLLPIIVMLSNQAGEAPTQAQAAPTFSYHIAEVECSIEKLDRLPEVVEQAIAQFLMLSPACCLPAAGGSTATTDITTQTFFMLQQRRLTEKLKERLGYLGVYYKRNSSNFYRHLPALERQEFLERLKQDYRKIVLCYFADDGTLNDRIDDFVNTAFFADISAAQVVEMHMDLMDEFARQLKLEGRSDEILPNYRLTLIDTLAHFCEMYRRSIPRES